MYVTLKFFLFMFRISGLSRKEVQYTLMGGELQRKLRMMIKFLFVFIWNRCTERDWSKRFINISTVCDIRLIWKMVEFKAVFAWYMYHDCPESVLDLPKSVILTNDTAALIVWPMREVQRRKELFCSLVIE